MRKLLSRIDLAIILLLTNMLVFSNVGGDRSAQAKDAKTLIIGVDGTYPPFSHRDLDGELSGFDVDIARALCKSMKVKCSLKQFSWSNLLPSVRGKKVDFAIGAINITTQRSELVTFINPYLKMPSALVVRNDSVLSGLTEEDLADAQIGVLESSPNGEYLRVHLPKTHVSHYKQETKYFDDLANKQLDGVIGNPVLLDIWLRGRDGAICCRLLGNLPHDRHINGEGLGIAVRTDNDKLLIKLNNALKSIKASETWAKIVRTHLPYLQ